MAALDQEFAEDVGGTLVHDPPERGRPASGPTVTLYKPDGTELVASSAATLDAVDTTISASAAAGDTSVTLTAVTGVAVGRDYLLKNVSSQREWKRVKAVNTTTKVVMFTEGLRHAYASADTFQGTRLSFAVTALHAVDRGEGFRAEWHYTVDGVARFASTMFDVVRTPWPDQVLSVPEFRKSAGELAESILQSVALTDDDFTDEIREAEQDLRADLLERGVRPSLFKSFVAFKRPVAALVILRYAHRGANIPAAYQGDPEAWRQLQEAEYKRQLERAIATTDSYDEDDSGTADAGERADTPARVVFSL